MPGRYNPRRQSTGTLPVIFGVVLLLVAGIGAAAYFATRGSEVSKEIRAKSDSAPQIEPKSEPKQAQRQIAKAKEREAIPNRESDSRAAWVAKVETDLARARRVPRVTEPVRGPLMTEAEYRVALETVEKFREIFRPDAPTVNDHICLSVASFSAAPVMPETVRVFKREGFVRMAILPDNALELRIGSQPELLRPLLDKQFLTAMRARSSWADRKALYRKFAAATGQKEPWSMLLPFDELNGIEMKAAMSTVEKLERDGLQSLSREERLLILKAGGAEFVEQRLSTSR